MGYVTVTPKTGEIDGKPIKWQVLSISGSIDGIENTLELKLNKTEAMLAKLLLNSDEQLKTGFGEDNGEKIIVSRKTKADKSDDLL